MAKKVLILGKNGMLGSMMSDYFSKFSNDFELTAWSRKEFDPTKDSLAYIANFDYVINCIGVIKPRMKDGLENAIFINSIFPNRLAKHCNDKNIKLIHITTDCVYSGKTDKAYDELSEHDAIDEYGKTKSLGEPKDCMVVRTSIIGPEKHGKYSFLEWLRSEKGKEINGFDSHFWNGLTTLELSKILCHIIQEDDYNKGTYHLYGQKVSKYDMCNTINDVYNLNIKINKVTSTDNIINRCLTSNKVAYRDISVTPFIEQIKQLKEYEDKQ